MNRIISFSILGVGVLAVRYLNLDAKTYFWGLLVGLTSTYIFHKFHKIKM